MVRPNHNVHVSINRRIEMPPAFHFPEDQIPPSDLVGLNNHDSPDNAQAVSGAYRLVVEFFDLLCHLSKQHECDFFFYFREYSIFPSFHRNKTVFPRIAFPVPSLVCLSFYFENLEKKKFLILALHNTKNKFLWNSLFN